MAFKQASHESAYLKAGLFGWQGSGKTWTACHIALGLHAAIASQKPVCFIDSETGSDFHVARFQHAGVPLLVDKTRSFLTLCQDMKEAEKETDILIVDSVTHFWQELMTAYKRKKNRSRLFIQDFGPLKDEWAQFSERFLNSRLHIILCGRAANVFEDVEEDTDPGEDKRWKAVKTGTKMSAEGNLAYEPSLLIEMERVLLRDGGKYARHAVVIKDRFGVLDGKEFTDPTFIDFLPHIDRLNLGGAHTGFDASQSSEGMFTSPDASVTERKRQQAVYWEEIEGLKAQYLPGTGAKERFLWTTSKEVVFGTVSDTEIQGRPPAVLKAGRDLLEHLIMYALEAETPPTKVGEFKRWLEKEKERYLAASVALQGVSDDHQGV